MIRVCRIQYRTQLVEQNFPPLSENDGSGERLRLSFTLQSADTQVKYIENII